ncbi:MAG: TIGR00266 family protein [Pirellulaceae bacterium]
MEIEILGAGAFESALVHLAPGERFVSESGALYRASANIDVDVTTSSRGAGGLLGGIKRLLAKEHFFFSTYATNDGRAGEVGLAPTHQGEVLQIDVDPSTRWLCAGGSYLGSSAGLKIDTQFQGLKGFATGESLVFVEVSGSGQLLVNAFGRIVDSEVEGSLTVDTGHLVAFESTLQYSITKAGNSWIQSWLAGEGVVMNFSGRGRIVTQSHNPREFGAALGRLLPPRK